MSASREPQAFDTAFNTAFNTRVLPQLGHHAPTLAAALCQRVNTFDRLVDGATAAVFYGG